MKKLQDREHISKIKVCWLIAEDLVFIKESIANNECLLVASYINGYIGDKEKKQYGEMNDDKINEEFESRILSIINQSSFYSKVKNEFDKIFLTLNREKFNPQTTNDNTVIV